MFNIGDKVYLSTRNLALEGPSLFKPRRLCPFPITVKHGGCGLYSQVPDEMRIHLTFHGSWVRDVPTTTADSVVQSVPIKSNLFQTPVLSILNVRNTDDGIRQFLCYREQESWTDATWISEHEYPTELQSRR